MLNPIRFVTLMKTFRSIKTARLLTVAVALPVLVWAYASGPNPHSEGGPGGPAAACSKSGCHVGAGNFNRASGKVELQFPGGLSYTPGQKQRIKVVITDPTARVYGFQASARLASNTAQQAGRFSTVGSTIILCEDSSEPPASGNCRATQPLEFIEHSNPSTANTLEFDWTP